MGSIVTVQAAHRCRLRYSAMSTGQAVTEVDNRERYEIRESTGVASARLSQKFSFVTEHPNG